MAIALFVKESMILLMGTNVTLQNKIAKISTYIILVLKTKTKKTKKIGGPSHVMPPSLGPTMPPSLLQIAYSKIRKPLYRISI